MYPPVNVNCRMSSAIAGRDRERLSLTQRPFFRRSHRCIARRIVPEPMSMSNMPTDEDARDRISSRCDLGREWFPWRRCRNECPARRPTEREPCRYAGRRSNAPGVEIMIAIRPETTNFKIAGQWLGQGVPGSGYIAEPSVGGKAGVTSESSHDRVRARIERACRGPLNASSSTIATAIPSMLAVIALFMVWTIALTTDSVDVLATARREVAGVLQFVPGRHEERSVAACDTKAKVQPGFLDVVDLVIGRVGGRRRPDGSGIVEPRLAAST